MSDQDDGPLAFPWPGDLTPNRGGMTLRDYFAAQIAGHCVPLMMNASAAGGLAAVDTTKLIADMAYELADDMLEARKR